MSELTESSEPNFVAYTQKSVIDRILTSWFRHTGFIPTELRLKIKKIEETDNDDHFRIEGNLENDF